MMEVAKHTPGPWIYDRNVGIIYGTPQYADPAQTGPLGDFEGCPPNEVNEVCTVNKLHVYEYWCKGQHYPAREDVKQRVRNLAQANADLISAAPELLAAAKLAVEDAVADDMDGWFRALKAAIAKAEGGAA